MKNCMLFEDWFTKEDCNHIINECEKLLDGLSDAEKAKAEKASIYTARYLWNFLSGMTSKHKIEAAA